MNGVNKAIIVGRLGKDPETKFMPSGDAVCNFSVATSESWKDKNSGEKVEKTDWHNIVVYRKLAEICGEYLRKGSQVYIEGKLKTRKYQDKQGNDRYITEIEAREMQMLGGKDQNQGSRQSSSAPPHSHDTAAAGSGSRDYNDDLPTFDSGIPF